MGVTIEQLQNAPVGSKLKVGDIYVPVSTHPSLAGERTLVIQATHYLIYDDVARLVIANPNVELVPPTPEITGWKVTE